MSQTAPPEPPLDRKREREIEKLELEIAELRRPLFRQPAVVYGGLGALVAIGGLALSTIDAWLKVRDARKEATAAQTKLDSLRKQIGDSETQLQTLTRSADAAKAEAVEASRRRDAAEGEVRALDAERQRLDAEGREKASQIEAREHELNQIKLQVEAELKRLAEIIPRLSPADRVVAEQAQATLPRPDLTACDAGEVSFFVAVGQAGTVVISADGGATWRRRQLGGALLTAVDATPDGRTICVGTQDGAVLVSEDAGVTFDERHRIDGRVQAVAVSPDGGTLAVASTARMIRRAPGSPSWMDAPSPLREWPMHGLLAADGGAVSAIGNAALPSAPGRPPEAALVELLFGGASFGQTGQQVIVPDSPTAEAVAGRAGGARFVTTWDRRGQAEQWGKIFEWKAGRWSKVRASRVPQVRSFWASPAEDHFVVISPEGKLFEARVNLTDWTEHPGPFPPLADVAGAPDGSVHWAVGKNATVLRRSADSPDWVVLPAITDSAP